MGDLLIHVRSMGPDNVNRLKELDTEMVNFKKKIQNQRSEAKELDRLEQDLKKHYHKLYDRNEEYKDEIREQKILNTKL